MDERLNAELCWARNDYDCAVSKAMNVYNTLGAKVKPKVLRLLAYSYLGKNDFINAKKYLDEFWMREKDPLVPQDYTLKAEIYAGAGTPCDQLYSLFLDGAAADSVLQSKIDYMNNAAEYFKSKNCKKQEADMRMVVFTTRKNPNPAGLFNLGLNYMQAGDLNKADSLFLAYNKVFPDSIYGYSFRGRINYTLDTTMTIEPFISNLLQNYEMTLNIAATDKTRFKSHGISAARTLAAYYVNIRNSKDTALTFIYKGLEIDSTDASLKSIRHILEKQPASKQTNQPKTPAKTNTKPVSSIKKEDGSTSSVAKK
jgi:tetratricopeptide (TPR) repeat protein